ncbi:MAG: hypothetical protein K2O18_19830 [Oscillospiraceae bacterium]|nr:hypothetical protein [Oscillospiraceae bacterium]
MKIFLVRKRYLVIGLGLLLAAAMFLAACLPEALAAKAAEKETAIQSAEIDGE